MSVLLGISGQLGRCVVQRAVQALQMRNLVLGIGPSGPSVYYPGDDSSGASQLLDASGNDRHMPTVLTSGAIDSVAGPTLLGEQNLAVAFTGGAFAELAAAAWMHDATFSASWWQWVPSFDALALAWSKDDAGIDYGLGVRTGVNGEMLAVGQSDISEWIIRTPDSHVSAGSWNHCALVADTNGLAFYVDGAKAWHGYTLPGHFWGTLQQDLYIPQAGNSAPLRLAKAGWSTAAEIRLCHVAFWAGYALTQNDINDLAGDLATTPDPIPHPFWGLGTTTPEDHGGSIQAALDAMGANGGGTVELGSGTYNTTSALTTYQNVLLRGQGSGLTVIDGGSMDDVNLLEVDQPSEATLAGWANDIAQGATSVAFAGHGRSEGDLVRFHTDQRFTADWDDGVEIRSYYLDAELYRLRADTDAGTLAWSIPAIHALRSSNQEDPVVAFTPRRHVGVVGVTLTRNLSSSLQRVVYIERCADFFLQDIVAVGSTRATIEIDKCNHGTIKDVDCTGSNDDGVGGTSYSLLWLNGSADCVADGITARDTRTISACGSTGDGYAITRRNVVRNGVMADRADTGGLHDLDCHANSAEYLFDNCVLARGISISGVGNRARNCTCTESGGHLIVAYEGGDSLDLRGIHFDAPNRWIYVNNGGLINSYFEDVTHSASPTGTSSDGSGFGNTYHNMDSPLSGWTEV